jgi:hypothetical protein
MSVTATRDGVLLTYPLSKRDRHCTAEPGLSGCTHIIQCGERYVRAACTPRHISTDGTWITDIFCLPCAEYWGLLDGLSVAERRELMGGWSL